MMDTTTHDHDGHTEPAGDDFSEEGTMSVPSRNGPKWSLAKKDRDLPRGLRRLDDGTLVIRYACALRHLHQERVGAGQAQRRGRLPCATGPGQGASPAGVRR